MPVLPNHKRVKKPEKEHIFLMQPLREVPKVLGKRTNDGDSYFKKKHWQDSVHHKYYPDSFFV